MKGFFRNGANLGLSANYKFIYQQKTMQRIKFRLSIKLAKVALVFSIHFGAFVFHPIAYLTALKWLILGKKVRASAQFAPLLSKSPKAYTYWSMRACRAQSPHNQEPPIWGLVAVEDAPEEAVEVTMQSLAAEGLQGFAVAGDQHESLTVLRGLIDWKKGHWFMPMRAGDRLAPGAAAAYRGEIAKTVTHLVYADDDISDTWGRGKVPHFKPDWNSELFRHFDYITGACVLRASIECLAAAATEKNWAAFLVRQSLHKGGAHHVPRVLHRRVIRPQPSHIARPLAIAQVLPKVSVIVPTRNRVDLLRKCLEGVASTQYPDLEVIVIDNDSDDPATLAYLQGLDSSKFIVLRHPGPFNYSAINNRAVQLARGKLLCLLNNDIEVLGPDWLTIMATQAQRDDVGAVGAQLLYPDGRIQHAGVVIGIGNAAGHAHRCVDPKEEGYFRRHMLPQFTSAVTGACLVVDRDRFLAAGGLDERNFPIAFNDVDLCLRLNRLKWQSLYEPRAVLIHHESVSRGHDLDPVGAGRFAGELAALKRIWNTEEIVDPFHHPCLSRAAERFALAF